MPCPCYSEDDHAGEQIVNDLKEFFRKLFGKKQKSKVEKPQSDSLKKDEIKQGMKGFV